MGLSIPQRPSGTFYGKSASRGTTIALDLIDTGSDRQRGRISPGLSMVCGFTYGSPEVTSLVLDTAIIQIIFLEGGFLMGDWDRYTGDRRRDRPDWASRDRDDERAYERRERYSDSNYAPFQTREGRLDTPYREDWPNRTSRRDYRERYGSRRDSESGSGAARERDRYYERDRDADYYRRLGRESSSPYDRIPGRRTSGDLYSGLSRDPDDTVESEDRRGWWDRASDEVSSWFGDEEAGRRRQIDQAGAGAYRGRGPRNYQRSDERIREDINDRLTDNPFLDAYNVEVSVSSGDVVLSGTVRDRYSKRVAEDITEEVSGVRNVENRLRVDRDELSAGTTPVTGSTAPVGTKSATTRST